MTIKRLERSGSKSLSTRVFGTFGGKQVASRTAKGGGRPRPKGGREYSYVVRRNPEEGK